MEIKLLSWVKTKFKKPAPAVEKLEEKEEPYLGKLVDDHEDELKSDAFFQNIFQRNASQDIVLPTKTRISGAMDSAKVMDQNLTSNLIEPNLGQFQNTVPNSLLYWYGNQAFIGYQMCAILAQHWLILKSCVMPSEDTVRNGFQIMNNDGTKLTSKVIDAIAQADKRYKLNKTMREFITKGLMFGFRIVIFLIESDDEDYYAKPFNIDGITPGSYKGMVQVDPYWITPELDVEAGANPASPNFYEPTWWRVDAKRIHHTHLVIFRNGELADLLKPTYLYGGIPLPQQIYERVYAAERTANEAPALAVSKRTGVLNVDTTKFLAKQGQATQRMQQYTAFKNNFGERVIDMGETYNQFDTSLADFDALIMTQYQIVSAIAQIPVTKLFGTTPKGFNSTGEYDEASYHERLEGLQTNVLTELVERHHAILIRSEIAPKFGMEPFDVTPKWNSLDARTEEEQAALNKLNAETGSILINSGSISPVEETKRIITDPKSGYTGLISEEEFNENGDPLENGDYEEYEKDVQNEQTRKTEFQLSSNERSDNDD